MLFPKAAKVIKIFRATAKIIYPVFAKEIGNAIIVCAVSVSRPHALRGVFILLFLFNHAHARTRGGTPDVRKEISKKSYKLTNFWARRPRTKKPRNLQNLVL